MIVFFFRLTSNESEKKRGRTRCFRDSESTGLFTSVCLSVYFFRLLTNPIGIPSGSNPSVQSCSIQCTGHQDPILFSSSTNRVCCLVGLTCLRLTFTGMIINWQFLLPLSLVPIGGIRPLLTHGWSQNKTTWVVVSPQVFFPDTHSIFRFRHFLPFYFFSFSF